VTSFRLKIRRDEGLRLRAKLFTVGHRGDQGLQVLAYVRPEAFFKSLDENAPPKTGPNARPVKFLMRYA
jgi:hypothetical protein